ncbi:hypothetical protein BGW80DRAFT_1290595 [Lactifluus volemus]|nr:hypothetical protein BGW80DRAFT_1290595 [Lactifluus volemus]
MNSNKDDDVAPTRLLDHASPLDHTPLTTPVVRSLGSLTPPFFTLDQTSCRWRLPLWLSFFGVTVSIFTLLYLLTGTIYPAANPWMRFAPIPLAIYRPGHQPPVSASQPLVQISYVEPDRVFTRVTQTGDVVMASPARMRRPSTSGPASVVDSTTSLLIQVRVPSTTRDAQCTITSGITLTRHLETAGKVARVQMWSLTEPTPGVGRGTFDVRPGDVLRSVAFAYLEVSCVDGDDACSVEVWEGLFRVEIRA